MRILSCIGGGLTVVSSDAIRLPASSPLCAARHRPGQAPTLLRSDALTPPRHPGVLSGPTVRHGRRSLQGGTGMNKRVLLTIALGLMVSAPAFGAEINIISAGAVEPGVVAAADAFRKETGTEVKIKFATAPAIQRRVGGGEAADVVIAPPALIEELAKAGKLDGSGGATVGRVGVGVLVRDGATKPDVSSADALKRALLDAESVVYNKASTGLYLEKLFDRLGVGADVKGKETRYPDGAAVMEHVIHGK